MLAAPRRVLALLVGVAVALVVLVAVAVPVRVARAADSTPTTTVPPTTEPDAGPTTTTTSPSPTSVIPPTTTTSPPNPADPNPTNPAGEGNGLSAAEALATKASFVSMTDTQRALLTRLQSASDALAIRRVALITLNGEVATANVQLDTTRASAAAASTEVERASARVRVIKHTIVRLAGAAYRRNATTPALSALDTAHAVALARARNYAQVDAALLEARAAELDARERNLEGARAGAEAARRRAAKAVDDLNERLAAQEQAVVDAASATREAQTAVALALGSGAGLLAQVVDPHFGADSITAVLARTQAVEPAPAVLVGRFRLPIPGAHLGSPYGMRVDPLTGEGGFHPGVDFGAAAGTPIHAAAAGVVVMAGDCGGYGNCVVIDNGDSLATVYAHQSVILSRVGEPVGEGQIIGLVGSTGRSTGPHLHFEVRFHGAPIDPVPTLIG